MGLLDDAHSRELAAAHGCWRVAGVDEVGRGPLAGPVVAAAVIVPDAMRLPLLACAGDSKKLSEKKRLMVAEMVQGHCVVGIGEASVEEIDRINILQASFLAMRRALEQVSPEGVVVDGPMVIPHIVQPQACVVGGDGCELAVACASVVAKVYRDALMRRLAEEFPMYGWHSNAGYGSAAHLAALRAHGITVHHRRSFAPVREVLEQALRKDGRDAQAA